MRIWIGRARWFALAAALAIGPAGAQQNSVRQSGTVTPGHVAKWVTNGVVGDAGTAANGSLTSVGVTNNGGQGVCVNSAPITQAYNQICMSATTNGGTSITTNARNGATTNTLSITNLGDPTAATDAVNKTYVDTIAGQGLHAIAGVRLATAAVLPNSPTYSNGSSGVGATLTAGSNAALVVDSTTVSANDRILVKDQAAQLQNGVYTVTTVGDGSTPWVLTRATDQDQTAEVITGVRTLATAGSTNIGTSWAISTTGTITIGTTGIVWAQLNGAIGTSSTVFIPRSQIYAIEYGVVPNDGIDHTTELNNAVTALLNSAANGSFTQLVLPCGQIIINGTITINTSNSAIAMVGCGPRATQFQRTAVNCSTMFALTTVPGSLFADFGIRSLNEETCAKWISLTTGFQVTFQNLNLQEPFIGMEINGSSGVYINNVDITGGTYFTDPLYKSGSRIFHITNTSGASSTVRLLGCNFGFQKYEYGVFVESVDGFQATNCHLSGGYNGIVTLRAANGTRVNGLRFTDVWIDIDALHNILAAHNASALTPEINNFVCVNCVMQGALNNAVQWDSTNSTNVIFNSSTFELAQGAAMSIAGINGLGVNSSTFSGNNITSSIGRSQIVLGASTLHVAMTGNVIAAGNNTDYNINVASGADYIIGTGNVNYGSLIANTVVATPTANIKFPTASNTP